MNNNEILNQRLVNASEQGNAYLVKNLIAQGAEVSYNRYEAFSISIKYKNSGVLRIFLLHADNLMKSFFEDVICKFSNIKDINVSTDVVILEGLKTDTVYFEWKEFVLSSLDKKVDNESLPVKVNDVNDVNDVSIIKPKSQKLKIFLFIVFVIAFGCATYFMLNSLIQQENNQISKLNHSYSPVISNIKNNK